MKEAIKDLWSNVKLVIFVYAILWVAAYAIGSGLKEGISPIRIDNNFTHIQQPE